MLTRKMHATRNFALKLPYLKEERNLDKLTELAELRPENVIYDIQPKSRKILLHFT